MKNKILNKYEKFKARVDNDPKYALLVVGLMLTIGSLSAVTIGYFCLNENDKKEKINITNSIDSVKKHISIEQIQNQH
jgi:hypothetical protein